MDKPTAKDQILSRLFCAGEALPVHDFDIQGCADTAISARLREMAREGLVVGRQAEGKRYKVWSLPKACQL